MKIKNTQVLSIGELYSSGSIKVSITVNFNGIFETGKEEWVFEQIYEIEPNDKVAAISE